MRDVMSSPPIPADLEALDPVPVNEDGGLNIFPSVTRLADGGFVTTWTAFDQMDEIPFLMMQKFDSYGCRVGDAVDIGRGLIAGVTELSDGSLVVVYSNAQTDQPFDVFYQLYDSDLAPVGSPVTVAAHVLDDDQNFPTVSALAGGGFVVAWNGQDATDAAGTYVQQYDNHGAAVGAGGRLADLTGTGEMPQIITLDDGSYFVTWPVRGDTVVTGLEGQRFAADGSKIGTVVEMISGLEAASMGFITRANPVTACAVAGGGYALAWNTDNGATGNDVFYQIFNPDGSTNSSVFQVTDAAGDQYSPVIVQLKDDTMVVAWADAPGAPAASLAVHVQRFAADGTPLEANDITLTGMAIIGLSIAADDNGGFVVNASTISIGPDGMSFDVAYEVFAPTAPVAMVGTSGDDFFEVHHAGDTIAERFNQGTDTVHTNLDSYTLGANLENLSYGGHKDLAGYGNGAGNVLTGGSHNDRLDGRRGADTMIGKAGDDIYYVDNIGDSVVEQLDEGTDQVRAAIDYTLAANVENLVLTGTAGIDGTGNALGNKITGNAGNNHLDGGDGDDVLNGGLGNDTMTGGAGDDKYHVDSSDDVVVESSGGGTDTVRASASYTLSDHVEVLVLTGSDNIDGTGSDQANTVLGNGGNNTLHGGLGDDTISGGAGNDVLSGDGGSDIMTGGTGDDSYYVDNSGDRVREYTGGGTDTVYSSIGWSLGNYLENLVLTGSDAVNGKGNGLDNTLTGNDGDNRLTGGLGADLFVFHADNGHDVITDFKAGQNDRIQIDAATPGVISQVGHDAVITLDGGNTITVLNTSATDADFLSHIFYPV